MESPFGCLVTLAFKQRESLNPNPRKCIWPYVLLWECIQLFRERLSQKKCANDNPKW